MEAVALVTLLMLLQFFWFGWQVGTMRGKHGVKAPAMSGHPEFERTFRVQQNTMEQLVLTIPALWLFAHYADPLWAAGFGAVFIIGRFIYKRGYVADPSKRSLGFTIGIIASSALVLGTLWNVGKLLYAQYLG